MSFTVVRAGLQTTVQGRPRTGLRHLGVPASGAADPLSLALANRLVGNDDLLAPGLESTFDGVSLRFDAPGFVAVTGAPARITLAGRPAACHRTLTVRPGEDLDVGAAASGARTYIAFAGGLAIAPVLGSPSTYLPAGLGGFQGRALARGDTLDWHAPANAPVGLATPADFVPPATSGLALRACDGAEFERLDANARRALYDANFTVGRRADRMGMLLEGPRLGVDSGGRLPSAPVFPGTLQCPEDGRPYLLGVDAQTTGGYARVAQLARCDRHMAGQLRPGDRVRFLRRGPDEAAGEFARKVQYWARWLPGVGHVL